MQRGSIKAMLGMFGSRENDGAITLGVLLHKEKAYLSQRQDAAAGT